MGRCIKELEHHLFTLINGSSNFDIIYDRWNIFYIDLEITKLQVLIKLTANYYRSIKEKTEKF